MSLSGKRDATVAFAGSPADAQQPRKRHRKSQHRQEQTSTSPVNQTALHGATNSTKSDAHIDTASPHNERDVRGLSRDLSQPSPLPGHKSAQGTPTNDPVSKQRKKEVDVPWPNNSETAAKAKENSGGKENRRLNGSTLKSTATRSAATQDGSFAPSTTNGNPKKVRSRTTSIKISPARDRASDLLKRPKESKTERLTKQEDTTSGKVNVKEQNHVATLGTHLVSSPSSNSKKNSKPSVLTLHSPLESEADAEQWKATSLNGGTFIDQDPILTQNDHFLILATHSCVEVYAAKTSLLTRSLRLKSKTDVTSCALSISDPDKLYVTNSKGLLSLWDWTTGRLLTTTNVGNSVRQVLPVHVHDQTETILVVEDDAQGLRSLVTYNVETAQGRFLRGVTILQKSQLPNCVRSYAQGNVLVTYVKNKILIGQAQSTADSQFIPEYTWREIIVPANTITCHDATVQSGKSKTSRKVPYLDIAIGLDDGAIMHYEDVLFKLIGKEKKNQSSSDDIIARKLHWHRTAVNTLKWSKDRNYIISGGNETVLVIWQLDSNQKQFLPHLSTPIMNLTVSATGTSYALRLADNSAMVLSTADLLPSSNITGLALGHSSQTMSATLLHPRVPNRLLAAVPANSFHNEPSTFLQVYNIDSSLQLTRQALTRNMITAANVAPTGASVEEPSVKHMKISHDGKWLASIDEWTPPNQDLESMYVSLDSPKNRGRTTETSLRLWLWSEGSDAFEQVTRIDEPHQSGPSSVLAMAFNPVRLELATMGSDFAVHIWTPKARHRNGVSVRNSANEQLYTWTCSRTIRVEHEEGGSSAAQATLAYAEDGSVIANSWSFSVTSKSDSSTLRFVHLVDPVSASIIVSQPSLLSHGCAKLLFHGRYLLCLSSSLGIFDTITCQPVSLPVQFDPVFVPPHSQAPIFLAHNKFDGTIAVGSGKSEWPRQANVSIFSLERHSTEDPENNAPTLKVVHQSSYTGVLKSLLASNAGPGYLLIDERSVVRVLKAGGVGGLSTHDSARVEPEEVTRGLDSILGRGSHSPSANGSRAIDDQAHVPSQQMTIAPAAVEDDNVGSLEQGLASVVRFTTTATAPGPAELFQRVLGVFARASA